MSGGGSEPGGASRTDFDALADDVDRLLRVFGRARARDGFTADDTLVFLALGWLGRSATRGGMAFRPVTCVDLAELLAIPRETVRRKMARLVDLNLAEMTRRGAMIVNDEKWLALAEPLKVGDRAGPRPKPAENAWSGRRV